MSAESALPVLHPYLLGFIWLTAAYLVGSIPEAWLIARMTTGKDLRALGSGNVGVMNTALSVSRWAGILVFLFEIVKGVAAVLIPQAAGMGDSIIGLAIIGVVLGIRWPLYLGFKGGRANTAGMAALGLLSPLTFAMMLILWYLLRVLTGKSFWASRLTMLSIPLIAFLVTHSWEFTLTGAALSAVYLSAQKPRTDDHMMIKHEFGSFWDFLNSPPREHHPSG